MTVKDPNDESMWESVVRKMLTDSKMRRELLASLLGQWGDTKNAAWGILAKEFRGFLDSTDIAAVITRVLTSVSFEIRTEVRFLPNDGAMIPRPVVKSEVKARSASDRPEPEEHDGGDL
jgi:hypothetical protein